MGVKIKLVVVGLLLFVAGFSLNNAAFSGVEDCGKVATIDIQKVAEASPQVTALHSAQKNKYAELNTFVKKAQADLAKQTNPSKKKVLEQKYNDELNSKKQAIDKEYSSKLSEIEKNVKATISEQAKKNNYDVVLAKGVVLYGGTDITEDVIKALK